MRVHREDGTLTANPRHSASRGGPPPGGNVQGQWEKATSLSWMVVWRHRVQFSHTGNTAHHMHTSHVYKYAWAHPVHTAYGGHTPPRTACPSEGPWNAFPPGPRASSGHTPFLCPWATQELRLTPQSGKNKPSWLEQTIVLLRPTVPDWGCGDRCVSLRCLGTWHSPNTRTAAGNTPSDSHLLALTQQCFTDISHWTGWFFRHSVCSSEKSELRKKIRCVFFKVKE